MKNNKILMIIFVIISFVLVLLTQTKESSAHGIVPGITELPINVTAKEPKPEEYVTLGFNNVFCVQQGAHVYSGDIFTITYYWTIDGRTSRAYAGNQGAFLAEHVNDENAMFAWMLLQPDDEGSNIPAHIYSNKQREIYTMFPIWANANEFYIATNAGGYGTSNWQASARAYADEIKNNPDAYITNNVDANNLVKEAYQAPDGTEYIKIGAFNWTFYGTFSSKTVYDQNNQPVAAKYAKYVGTELVMSDSIGDIVTSGQDFYLLIPVDSGTTKINNFTATVSATRRNITAQMWVFQKNATASTVYQNIISTVAQDNYVPTNATITIENIDLTGSIKIIKSDPDRINNPRLPNVGFEIQNTDNGKWVKQQGNAMHYVDSRDEATEFITDANGEILVENLLIGNYAIYETQNGNRGYELITEPIEGEARVNEVLEYEITNKRVYITLSGTVWEDMLYSDGKGYDSNKLYKNGQLDTEDRELEHVTVRLRHMTDSSLERETTTDVNGTYTFEDVLIDELQNFYVEFEYNGMCYQSIPTDPQELGTNDENYVAQDGYEDVRSKAEEGESRTEFNANYAIITNGQSNNSNGEKVYDLSYDRANYTSTLTYGENAKDSDAFGYEGQRYPITKVDSQYLISATTLNSYNGGLDNVLVRVENSDSSQYVKATPEAIRTNSIEEISNINLGVQEREQPNLELVKDLNNVKVVINNKFQVYEYGVYMKETDHETGDLGIKFQNKRNGRYTRALYKSDVDWLSTDNPANGLEIYVTYEIAITNTSTNLVTKVNNIIDYYEQDYDEIVAIGDEIDIKNGIVGGKSYISEEIGTETVNDESGNAEQYIAIDINIDETIEMQTTKSIYVQFKLTRDTIRTLSSTGESLLNFSEITSYSVYENQANADENIPYAGIDTNSNPGNVTLGEVETYEDDTDTAYGFTLVTDPLITLPERAVTGTVFEDNPTFGVDDEIHTNEIREGDGIYDETTESTIEGIKVTLMTKEDTVAQVYKQNDEGVWEWTDAITYTDENGTYSIEGFIPGDYYIEYTWGSTYNENYSTEKYKSTIVDIDGGYYFKQYNENWYAENFGERIENNNRYSDVLDEYEIRKQIDELNDVSEVKTINHQTVLDSGNEMISKTKDMDLGIETMQAEIKAENYIKGLDVALDAELENEAIDGTETYEYVIDDVDFGIIERARQQLKVEKIARNLTLTLTDGRILANIEIASDGSLIDKTNTVGYVEPTTEASQTSAGLIRVEVDNELLQNATAVVTYEIRVTNTSEKDYADMLFYSYGSARESLMEESSIMKLVPQMIIDYVDNSWVLSMNDNNNSTWDSINLNEVRNQALITDEAIDAVNNNDIAIKTTDDLETVQLKPSESRSVYISFNKLLTTTDEISLENEVEIVSIGKTGGKAVLYKEIPGNYQPRLGDQEEDDDQAARTAILPSTGANLNYLPLVTLIISSCLILVTGTILIKKLVLGER